MTNRNPLSGPGQGKRYPNANGITSIRGAGPPTVELGYQFDQEKAEAEMRFGMLTAPGRNHRLKDIDAVR